MMLGGFDRWLNAGRLAAAATLLILALAPAGSHAQLRGLGGSAGGLGGGIVGGRGIAPPDLGNDTGRGGGPLGGAVPGAPPLPSTDAPTGRINTNAITNTLNGPVLGTVTGPVTNTLSVPRDTIRGLGGTLDRSARNVTGAAGTVVRRSGVPPAGERRFVPNEVVVGLPTSLSPQVLDGLLRRHRLTRLETRSMGLTGVTMHRVQVTDGRSVSDVIRAIESERGVGAAQPNYRYTLQAPLAGESTSERWLQYVLAKLQIPEAHHISTGERILVALIDSGIDVSHPEIAGSVAGSYDALNSKEGPHSHGTAMAGAIVAHGRLAGIAPSARILAARAFGAATSGADGTTFAILMALDWSLAQGARVINMSFAGPSDPEIARALATAHKKGIVLVAAAGNAGPKSPPLFPASDPNVIAVTATDSKDELFRVAVRGRHIAVAAPGVEILGPAPDRQYQLSSGTSVAAAQVSGIVALLLQRKPDLKPDTVRRILTSSATDLGPKGRDDQFGSGLANGLRALQAADRVAPPTEPTNVSSAR